MLYEGRKAKISLRIVVVGGGIGGLSAAHCLYQAGHQVTVIDPRDLPAEFGAGVQLPPNVSRILYKWGLKSELNRLCKRPRIGCIHYYDTGEHFTSVPYAGLAIDGDGAAFYGVYRPDLVTMIYDLVKDDITVVKGKVVSVDPEEPSVTLEDGDILTADLIIGADGVRSIVRPTVMPTPDKPVISGHTAYRAMISVDEMAQDLELNRVVIDDLYGWVGPEKRVIAYGIGHGLYNLVLLVPDVDPEGPWAIPADLDELKAWVDDCEPRVKKLISYIKTATRYKLVVRAPLDNWTHEKGRVTLLGDSAHGMLPYYAQGAAMAIEDASVLGNLLSRISSADQIPSFLQAYQKICLPRANLTQAKSLENANILNVAHKKGQETEHKTNAMSNGTKHSPSPGDVSNKSNPFSEKVQAERQYGYDTDKAVEAWWRSNGYKHYL